MRAIASFIFLFITCVSTAQDSIALLKRQLSAENNKENIKRLNSLAKLYTDLGNTDSVTYYAKQALEMANNMDDTKGISFAESYLGYCSLIAGDFKQAIVHYQNGADASVKLKNNGLLKAIYQPLALAYLYTGDYRSSLQYFIKTDSLSKLTNDHFGSINALLGMSNIYSSQKDLENAIKYATEALNISKGLNHKANIVNSYSTLGNIHYQKGELPQALDNYRKALEVLNQGDDKKTYSLILANIGTVLTDMKQYEDAINNFEKAIAIQQELNDPDPLSNSMINVGILFAKKKDFEQAAIYLQKGLKIARQLGRNEVLKSTYKELADVYAQSGKFKEAYDYSILFSNINDTITNYENSKLITEMQTKYDTEKKELALKEKESELITQRYITYLAAAGILLLIALAIVILRNNRMQKDANRKLGSMNELLNLKNKEVTDSINYAQRIQSAILPSYRDIKKVLPQSFVLYMPKAIVSGDFYFFSEQENHIFLAAADCTGHGVPGALMSMVGSNIISQLVTEKRSTSPSDILNELNSGIRKALKQDQEAETNDGMDIAFCVLEKNMQRLQFSGANRPLYIIRDRKLEVVKPDKFPIGGSHTKDLLFSAHEVQLQKGDMLYLFSDGYADQFGGQEGKKMMIKSFQKLLLQVQHEEPQKQRELLLQHFNSWKGELEQIDDVLVIGIRV